MKKRVNTYLAIAITTYCNYQCFYCKKGGESISKEKETISFDDVKKIIANAYANGIANFRITGGEPTSVSYFCELIEYIMKFKDTKVRINTNGFRILEYIDVLTKYKEYTILLSSNKNQFYLKCEAEEKWRLYVFARRMLQSKKKK